MDSADNDDSTSGRRTAVIVFIVVLVLVFICCIAIFVWKCIERERSVRRVPPNVVNGTMTQIRSTNRLLGSSHKAAPKERHERHEALPLETITDAEELEDAYAQDQTR
eukprot:CAMPEP_0202686200 /NCGR_PEP_ID=MMETSP1385-20130828/2006_1 /ASSEMBLY_ACC=CAM_ASM_000861 /TAXON_ID=933848 /ORGANISM="Elphidium margaritaceum" /LENGTH=107 /DNA_ID=CAMNT_0049340731 /DNA_START=145 /DNA_END=468 /DNA_ORIENTATION=+